MSVCVCVLYSYKLALIIWVMGIVLEEERRANLCFRFFCFCFKLHSSFTRYNLLMCDMHENSINTWVPWFSDAQQWSEFIWLRQQC